MRIAGDRVPADPEGAAALTRDGVCLGEDLESGWYRGRQIDLGSTMFEVVALGLPVKPLCREECRGLCLSCGADRNTEDCSCRETRPQSPFSVLEKLRTGGSAVAPAERDRRRRGGG